MLGGFFGYQKYIYPPSTSYEPVFTLSSTCFSSSTYQLHRTFTPPRILLTQPPQNLRLHRPQSLHPNRIPLPNPPLIPLRHLPHKIAFPSPFPYQFLKRPPILPLRAPNSLIRRPERTRIAPHIQAVYALDATENFAGDFRYGVVVGAAADEVDAARLRGNVRGGGGGGDEVLGAEAEGEELGFDDCAGPVAGQGPRSRGRGEDISAGAVGVMPGAGGDVGDDFGAGEVEG